MAISLFIWKSCAKYQLYFTTISCIVQLWCASRIVSGIIFYFEVSAPRRHPLVSCWTALLFSAPASIGLRLLFFCRESQRTLHWRRLVAIFPARPRFFWPSCLQLERWLPVMRQRLRFPWSRYPRAGTLMAERQTGYPAMFLPSRLTINSLF